MTKLGIINTKKDEEGNIYFDIRDIVKGTTVNPNRVKYYDLKKNEDKSLTLTLYDKNMKQLKPKKRRSR